MWVKIDVDARRTLNCVPILNFVIIRMHIYWNPWTHVLPTWWVSKQRYLRYISQGPCRGCGFVTFVTFLPFHEISCFAKKAHKIYTVALRILRKGLSYLIQYKDLAGWFSKKKSSLGCIFLLNNVPCDGGGERVARTTGDGSGIVYALWGTDSVSFLPQIPFLSLCKRYEDRRSTRLIQSRHHSFRWHASPTPSNMIYNT